MPPPPSITLLAWTAKTSEFETSFGNMLGLPTGRPGSPESERRRAQLGSHQMDDFSRGEPKLTANRIEARAIFPCHLNDAVRFGPRENFLPTLFHPAHLSVAPHFTAPTFSRILRAQLTKLVVTCSAAFIGRNLRLLVLAEFASPTSTHFSAVLFASGKHPSLVRQNWNDCQHRGNNRCILEADITPHDEF